MWQIIAALVIGQANGPFWDAAPGSGSVSVSGGEIVGATAACVGADSVLADNNGYVGCPKLTDVAPQGLMLRSQPAFPGGTQTASNVVITGGQDETTIAIDGADPSATCAGDNDTVTVTVINSNGTSTATVLTEETEWTASASVADTCASLATGVTAVTGVTATCTSPNVLIVLDATTAFVTLAESTAACTTVSAGTPGHVLVGSGTEAKPGIAFAEDPDSGIRHSGASIELVYGGADIVRMNASGFFFDGVPAVNLRSAYIYTSLDATQIGGACTPGVAGDACVAGAFIPAYKTSDPCGTYPAGSMFYNSTSNYMCFCNGSGADIKMNDNATACF